MLLILFVPHAIGKKNCGLFKLLKNAYMIAIDEIESGRGLI
jgi:hypothetical protein